MKRWLRAVALVLAMFFTSDVPALAIDLNWSGGRADLALQVASPCTLLVSRSARESWPPEWRLTWVAEQPNGSPPGFGAGIGSDPSCGAPDSVSIDDLLGNVVALPRCSSSLGLSSIAYVMRCPAGLRARVELATMDSSGNALLPAALRPFVTVNGGTPQSYPPILSSARLSRNGSQLKLTCRGVHLDGVRAIELRSRRGLQAFHFAAGTQQEALLEATGTEAVPLPAGDVLITDALGRTSALWIAGEVLSAPVAPKILVRFEPGTVDPPVGSEGGGISNLASSSDLLAALRSSGVTAVSRLFPAFRHGDVHSVNSLGEPVQLEDLADIYVAELSPGLDPRHAAALLGANRNVHWATVEVGGYSRLGCPSGPDDPLYSLQWSLHTGATGCGSVIPSPFAAVNAPSAWCSTIGSSVQIGFLDTGIDITHEDLPNAVLGPTYVTGTGTSMDDDNYRHGTAVASIAAAVFNNTLGISGVAPDAIPIAIKVSSNGSVMDQPSWQAMAIEYCRTHNIPIISSAIGLPDISWKTALKDACLDAFYSGNMMLAAIGNNNDATKIYPAALTNRVYAVGAVWMDFNRWQDQNISTLNGFAGSNFGPWIDICAPGGHVVDAAEFGPNGYYTTTGCVPLTGFGWGFGGTSSAAPVVAGVAALVKSVAPSLMGEDLEQVLNLTARDVVLPPATFGWDADTGWGVVRADSAVALVSPPNTIRQGSLGLQGNYGGLVIADSGSVLLSRSFQNVPGLPNGTYSYRRYRMRGTAHLASGWSVLRRLWVRNSGSMGWRDSSSVFDYDEEVRWGRVVPGSVGGDSAVFETFVDRIPSAPGSKWWPSPPESARVGFTAIGIGALVGVSASGSPITLSARSYPNPAFGQVILAFSLPVLGRVRITLHDITGRVVATLADNVMVAGEHEIHWMPGQSAGHRVEPGMYFARVECGGRVATTRVVVMGRSR
jgi:subtilisin family serine protease